MNKEKSIFAKKFKIFDNVLTDIAPAVILDFEVSCYLHMDSVLGEIPTLTRIQQLELQSSMTTDTMTESRLSNTYSSLFSNDSVPKRLRGLVGNELFSHIRNVSNLSLIYCCLF